MVLGNLVTDRSRPLIEMFWVAEYKDGTALPQYDIGLRVENKFGQVLHKKVRRFWWLPITPKMAQVFPGTRWNPRLKRHHVQLDGSKGFVCRRTLMEIGIGSRAGTRPHHRVKCYVLGIEGGPRREIYPNGTVIDKEWPTKGETQDILHS